MSSSREYEVRIRRGIGSKLVRGWLHASLLSFLAACIISGSIGVKKDLTSSPERHFGRKQRCGSLVSLTHVNLSAHMAAFSLSLSPRRLDVDETAMAVGRQQCGWLNRHVGATTDCHNVDFDQNAARVCPPSIWANFPEKCSIKLKFYFKLHQKYYLFFFDPPNLAMTHNTSQMNSLKSIFLMTIISEIIIYIN